MNTKWLIGFVIFSLLPAAGQRRNDGMYANFKTVVERSRLSLAKHPSYTEHYVTGRASLFCGLMTDRNITRLTQEISLPPVRWTESPKDRPRLEAAILISGTPAMCPANQQIADQWLRTYMR